MIFYYNADLLSLGMLDATSLSIFGSLENEVNRKRAHSMKSLLPCPIFDIYIILDHRDTKPFIVLLLLALLVLNSSLIT